MKSMTGYGRATGVLLGDTLTVQVSAVNRKTLDLTMKLPPDWESLESSVGEYVRRYAARGKVHVQIELTGTAGASEEIWDEDAAANVLDRLSGFAARQGVPFTPTAELLWEISRAQRKADDFPSAESAQATVLTTLEIALRAFAAMRAKEGESLLIDFLGRLEILRRNVEIVATRAPLVPIFYRDQLLQRLRAAELEFNLEDERVLKEIALFADRCDVTEELTRLRSHLEQFAALLKSDGEIGRKSEFILQEIGREVNTIGSKANDLTISRAVIELKNELERIREQIANVE
ncbi:MAG: YicC/YloC family endoribonuclease [Opitutaceae bacterium]